MFTDIFSNEEKAFSMFERWPNWFFYIPVVAYCLYLSYRYKSFSLPTIANPRITTGGLCGESKTDIFKQASAYTCKWIASYETFLTSPQASDVALTLMKKKKIDFPVIIKPDIGCHGNGIKFVNNPQELRHVCRLFRPHVPLIVQEYIPWEQEAGIFYMRYPSQKRGKITSIALKNIPYVTGDGKNTILQLILKNPRLKQIKHYFEPRLTTVKTRILKPGERYFLSRTGNHCKGAEFKDGREVYTEILEQRIDHIMHGLPEFYFGRIDIRFRSIEELKQGNDFRIIEFNGIGGEAAHIWDRSTKLIDAYKTVFQHWRECYAIGYENKLKGYKPCNIINCLRAWNEQRKLMKLYPVSD